MGKGSPIACDLTALDPAQRARRGALAARLTAARVEIRELPDGYAVRFASDISLMDSGDISADEVRDTRDAFFDRFLRRGVGEAHMLAFAGDATAEVNIG